MSYLASTTKVSMVPLAENCRRGGRCSENESSKVDGEVDEGRT